MVTSNLKFLREAAFLAQAGQCCYCGLPMWQSSPSELGLKAGSGAAFRCTAEHLVAKQDGGRDEVGNVAAAHAWCNRLRHARKGPAPSPDAYRAFVQRRLSCGKWWSPLPHGVAGKLQRHPATKPRISAS